MLKGEYEEMLEGLREEVLDLVWPVLKGKLSLKVVRSCNFLSIEKAKAPLAHI